MCSDILFSVLVPCTLAPLVGILLWSERRAARMGLVPDLDLDAPGYEGLPSDEPVLSVNHSEDGRSSPLSPLSRRAPGLSSPGLRSPPSPTALRRRSRRMSGISCMSHSLVIHHQAYTYLVASGISSSSWWIRGRRFAAALDLPGLILLAAGVALLLIPLTLSHASLPPPSDEITSALVAVPGLSAKRVSLFISGLASISAFLWWDLQHASSPVIARPFINNKTVMIAAGVGFFDFVSHQLRY
jgi:hypothetical protein